MIFSILPLAYIFTPFKKTLSLVFQKSKRFGFIFFRFPSNCSRTQKKATSYAFFFSCEPLERQLKSLHLFYILFTFCFLVYAGKIFKSSALLVRQCSFLSHIRPAIAKDFFIFPRIIRLSKLIRSSRARLRIRSDLARSEPIRFFRLIPVDS